MLLISFIIKIRLRGNAAMVKIMTKFLKLFKEHCSEYSPLDPIAQTLIEPKYN